VCGGVFGWGVGVGFWGWLVGVVVVGGWGGFGVVGFLCFFFFFCKKNPDQTKIGKQERIKKPVPVFCFCWFFFVLCFVVVFFFLWWWVLWCFGFGGLLVLVLSLVSFMGFLLLIVLGVWFGFLDVMWFGVFCVCFLVGVGRP